MSGVPARATIERVRRIEAVLEPHDWAWARENRPAIEAHWAARVAAKPAMFNGPVLLAHPVTVADGEMRVRVFESDYASLTTLIDQGFPDRSVTNVFSALAPRTTDGAYLLGRMGRHTARAGHVYFACGTPDRSDVGPDGRVDFGASARREFAEETGIVRTGEPAGWVVVRESGFLALIEPVALDEEAEAAIARIEAHLAREAVPELDGLVAVRGPADIDPACMPPYVRAFLHDAFLHGTPPGDTPPWDALR